jgi:putative peptidoglycan lipid II flippase
VQLNLQKQYEVGSVLPVALNIFLIMGIVSYGYIHDIIYIAISVFFAGMVQVLYCMYRVYRIRGVIFPYLRDEGLALRGLMKQASYGLMAQMITYASSILELLLVSFLVTGSLSWLYYAERLAFLPIGVVSVVLANIVLTDLTQACKSKDMARVSDILQKSSRWVLVVAFPSMVGGFFLADNIIALLFGSSHFQWNDVMACAEGFRVMALAIPFLMMVRVWNVVPYAFSKPQHLLRITSKSFIISTFITLLCISRLQHVAICLGGLVGGICNAYQLHNYISESTSSVIIDIRLAQRIIFSSMMMAIVLKVGNIIWPMTLTVTKFELLYALLIKSGISMGVWLIAMRSFKVNWQVLFD